MTSPAPPRIGLRDVVATRYILPLREGGSLPGLMEADDLGTYVVKFRGAGQGRKALVAEVLVGELARALGLPVPELVVISLDPELGRAEPDPEVQDLLLASGGTNLGIDYLPGALGFDPLADSLDALDPDFAARVLWLDAYVQNVDRSWRNANLLRWHGRIWLIDHGAAVYFHHDWRHRADAAAKPYPVAEDHALLCMAAPLLGVDAELAPAVTPELLRDLVAVVPEEWLDGEPGFPDVTAVREAYVDVLARRAAVREPWLHPVEEARAAAV